MREVTLFSIPMPYREQSDVKAFVFGEGEPEACFVGALRGNEVQQVYICSQLVHRLRHLEEKGCLVPGKQIMVVPCANHVSMNIGKRFWPSDNTDINRMFPGYDGGETTQRIAAYLFEAVKGYRHGIQFASFYLEGDFMEHVRIMSATDPAVNNGALFGLPYVIRREPDPFDTTTLNYNWRLWDTDAYSVYTEATDTVDEDSAQVAIRACLRFLANCRIIDYPSHQGYASSLLNENCLVPVHTHAGGFFQRLVNPGDAVSQGRVIARVLNPLTGDVAEEVEAASSGVVFFACKNPLVAEHTLAFNIIPRGADFTPAL